MNVARAILTQLGGGKFVVMTGAKHFKSESKALSFKLPSTPHYVKDNINYIRIELTPADLYTVSFYNLMTRRKSEPLKLISQFENVYNEDLIDLFRDTTGLETVLSFRNVCRD